MIVRFFDNTDDFVTTVGPYLERREAENNLPIGILAAIQAGQYAEHVPLLASVEDGDQIEAVAIRTPPHNLLLSFDVSAEAISALAEALRERGEDLPGVTADAPTATAFAEGWARLGGPRFEVARSERVYRLDSVRTAGDANGTMRCATEDDRPLVLEWLRDFATDTGEPGNDDPNDHADRFIPARAGTSALVLWEVDGQPVSMAGHTGPTPRGMRVTAVYTPPSLRRRGYASACVAALSRRLLDSGRRYCFLYTDLANPTSNHIYREIGYEPVCDVAEYRVAVVP